MSDTEWGIELQGGPRDGHVEYFPAGHPVPKVIHVILHFHCPVIEPDLPADAPLSEHEIVDYLVSQDRRGVWRGVYPPLLRHAHGHDQAP